ncbi:MAG: AAA family ATPase [Patescibacteria group bacterium]
MSEQATYQIPVCLAPDALRRVCTQEEVAQTPNSQESGVFNDLFIGVDQARLLQALQLGLHESSKNHIFIAGMSGPQALNAVKTFITDILKSSDKKSTDPRDWCYIYNFDNPLEPIVIALNKKREVRLEGGGVAFRGGGVAFRERIEKLLAELRERIPSALVRDEILSERQTIALGVIMWWESERLQIVKNAKNEEIYIVFEENLAHVRCISRIKGETIENGKRVIPIMEPEELAALAPDEYNERIATRDKWVHLVNVAFVEYERRSHQTNEAVSQLNRRVVGEAVDAAFARVQFTSSQQATSYAYKLKQFAVDNFTIFDPNREQHDSLLQQKPFLPWAVNVLVNNSDHDIPPVVVDYDGTFENLVGRIGRIAGHGGVVYTDHTMITAGSLVQANNGYLIVDAMNVLQNSGSYQMLKRVLSNEILKIEDLMSFYGMGSIMPLQPMPIPLNVKVIMVGSHYLWSMLAYFDPEFLNHFELKAQVVPSVDWTPQETSALANATRQYAKTTKLLPFQDNALQRIVEQAGRFADTQTQLSTDFRQLEPIIREASYLAEQENAEHVSASHVRNALERKFYRSNWSNQQRLRMIRDKKIILPLKGEAVGQITILSVSDFGDVQIGFPARLTCEWSMGRPGFISIQREAKLAGNILTKGELTVQKYLESFFAKKYPFAVNISYTVEQTYGKVDGDSASMALFYCVISALSEVPIRQDIAITGSISQRGEIQPIGGVNEKIEGFFESCLITGLTGTQGVIIPHSNTSDLMLNDHVLDAVGNGVFHIWAITSVTEGIRILMGRDAGERKSDFTFTENSVYSLVDKQLREIAINARNFFAKNDDLEI